MEHKKKILKKKKKKSLAGLKVGQTVSTYFEAGLWQAWNSIYFSIHSTRPLPSSLPSLR